MNERSPNPLERDDVEAVKEIVEQGVRDFVDLEAFKEAAEPPAQVTSPSPTPSATTTTPTSPAGSGVPPAPQDLPTEVDVKAYIELNALAGADDVVAFNTAHAEVHAAATAEGRAASPEQRATQHRRWEHADSNLQIASRNMLFRVGILVMLILAVGAAMVAGRIRAGGPDESATTTAGGVVASSAPAPADSGAPAAQTGLAEECVLPASTISTTLVDLTTEFGVAHPDMFQTLWRTQVTNLSDQPVTVVLHTTEGVTGGRDDWSAVTIGPGASSEESGYLSNNAGGYSGPVHGSYVDQVLVLADRPECRPPASGPDDAARAQAVAVTVPSAP